MDRSIAGSTVTRGRRKDDRPPGKAGWRMSKRLFFFEVLAFVVFALLAGAAFLAWRLSQGPIDLEFFRPMIERSMTDARGGQPVKIQSLVLEWSKNNMRVEVAARDVTALDASNTVVSRAGRAVITLDAGALLSGKLKTRQLRLEDGQINVQRSAQGVWSVANVEVFREPARRDKPFDFFTDLKWSQLAQPIRALLSTGSFERVDIVNFRVDVADAGSGMTWAANPVNGVWTANQQGVSLSLDVGLGGAPAASVSGVDANKLTLTLGSDAAVSRATGSLALEGVDPSKVAQMFGVPATVFTSQRPANASFTVAMTERGGLESGRLTLQGASGQAKIGPVDFNVSSLDFEAVYDPATQRVDIPKLVIASDRATGEFSGSLDASRFINGHIGQGTPFKLQGREFTLAITPMFEGPWAFHSAAVEGEIASDGLRLKVASLTAVTGAATVTGTGEFWLDGPADNRLVGAVADARVTGAITPQQVLAFWPVNLGADGRSWTKNHVLGGTASNAVFHINWQPGANSRGYIDNDVLSLEFDMAGGSVMYLADFPPITEGAGHGRLEGNRLVMDITSARAGAWTVDEGKVDLPQFYPRGGIMQITGTGSGGLRELMRVLDASTLKTGQKYGLNIEGMSGSGHLALDLRMPMIPVIPPEDIKYTVTGGFRDAAAPDLAFGFGLTDSDVTVNMDETHLAFTGAGRFGPARTAFDWNETFNLADKTSRSELKASAIVTPDLLNAFGFAARTMMQGEADVQLRASGSGRNFSSIVADMDFTKAALDISELGWTKRYDTAAHGTFRYGSAENGRGAITGDIRSEGLQLSGDAELNAQGELVRADIERIFSRGSVDLSGQMVRRADGGYRVQLAGPFMDATTYVEGFLNMDSSSIPPPPANVGGPGPAPTITLDLTADKLRLRETVDLSSAHVQFELGDRGPVSGNVTGLAAPGKRVEMRITSEGSARRVHLESQDAGFAARVILNADWLLGGTMTMDGRFDGPIGQAQVTMSDVRLRDAPVLAQILSLASLRGLTDVLNGDGVLFTNVEVPLGFDHGRVDIRGLRASGPAMGLTSRGWIQPKEGNISLDGVLVPSFGINSVLGGIPIIGDLFVSRQGEGVFSPIYQVRGTLASAQVAINPVAAITPGFVRRIFENPGEPPPVAEMRPAATPTPGAPASPAAPAPRAPGTPAPRASASPAPAPR
jgi:hypothetical protein